MKRRMKMRISAVMAALVLLTGCGGNASTTAGTTPTEKSAEEYVQLMQEKLGEAKGFQATYYNDILMDNEKDRTRVEGTVQMNDEPLLAAIDTTIYYGEDEKGQKSGSYFEETEDTVNLYMSYENQWTEMNMPREDALRTATPYHAQKKMQLLLTAGENWTMEETEDGKLTLSGVVPASKVYVVSEEGAFLQQVGMSGIGENYYANVTELNVRVQADTEGAPLSYEVDFAAVLETVFNNVLTELNGGENTGITVQKCIVKQEFSALGEAQAIEIPTAAKDDAINYEREISLLESSLAKE